MNGELSTLKKYFVNKEDYMGKMLTVEFFSYTVKNHVPKHGRAVRFRDPNF